MIWEAQTFEFREKLFFCRILSLFGIIITLHKIFCRKKWSWCYTLMYVLKVAIFLVSLPMKSLISWLNSNSQEKFIFRKYPFLLNSIHIASRIHLVLSNLNKNNLKDITRFMRGLFTIMMWTEWNITNCYCS